MSFNVPYRTHFRITNLPLPDVLAEVFRRMEEVLLDYAANAGSVTALKLVDQVRR